MRWNYLHTLEYRREISRYERVLAYTEHIEDHGFCFHSKGLTRVEYYEQYTKCCAVDYLRRRSAVPGSYVVTAIRHLPGSSSILCSIRIHWRNES